MISAGENFADVVPGKSRCASYQSTFHALTLNTTELFMRSERVACSVSAQVGLDHDVTKLFQ